MGYLHSAFYFTNLRISYVSLVWFSTLRVDSLVSMIWPDFALQLRGVVEQCYCNILERRESLNIVETVTFVETSNLLNARMSQVGGLTNLLLFFNLFCLLLFPPSTENVHKLISAVHNLVKKNKPMTLLQLAEAMRGTGKNKEVLGVTFDQLLKVECEQLIVQLLIDGVFAENFHHTGYSAVSYIGTVDFRVSLFFISLLLFSFSRNPSSSLYFLILNLFPT
jgi:hypothetical protein